MKDLHDAILNLPCTPDTDWPRSEQSVYSRGHRDALHAAAELAIAAPEQAAIGFIESAMNRERRCGPVIWTSDLSGFPNGTKIYAGRAPKAQPAIKDAAEICRFDLFGSLDGGGPAESEQSSNGAWVRYEDHAAAVLAAQKGRDA